MGALAQRPDRLGRRDARDRLERLGDLGARQSVAPGPALSFHVDEVRVEQHAEVLADRRGRDPGLVREHARGQGAAVGQRHQHPGPAGLADERGDAGDVGVTGHATTVAPGHFGARRSDRDEDWADGAGRHVRGLFPGPARRDRAERRCAHDRCRSRRRRHRAAVGRERIRAGVGGTAAGRRRARGRQRAPAGGPGRARAVRCGVGGVRARADGRGARRGAGAARGGRRAPAPRHAGDHHPDVPRARRAGPRDRRVGGHRQRRVARGAPARRRVGGDVGLALGVPGQRAGRAGGRARHAADGPQRPGRRMPTSTSTRWCVPCSVCCAGPRSRWPTPSPRR